jgi:hypothetical protein
MRDQLQEVEEENSPTLQAVCRLREAGTKLLNVYIDG